MNKNVFGWLPHLLLISALACTASDRQPKTSERELVQDRPANSPPCRQIVWREGNTSRYEYTFDASRRLSQCIAVEQTNSAGTYALNQQLTYTKGGMLERVCDEEDSSRYSYRDGRLATIDFFQAGRPVYRYLVTSTEQGQIVGLRGVPLNDSGLLACSTRYRLDGQGRYVQLDMEDDRGVLYFRVKQQDFVPVVGHLYESMGSVPYDLNRYPWLNWSAVFPLSPYLAKRVETFRYAAPETPTELIKRADLSLTWQRDKQGHLTGQFSTDALTTIRDTILIDYLNCQ